MKTTSLILLLWVCVGVSCTQYDTPATPDVKHLTSIVLNSDKFKTLDIDASRLNLAGAMLDATPTGKKLLIIPAKTDPRNHALLTILDDSYQPAISAYLDVTMNSVEGHAGAAFKPAPVPDPTSSDGSGSGSASSAPTSPSYDPVSLAYHQGTLNATISVTASTNYRALYNFYNSNVTGVVTVPIGPAANTDRCRGWTETGGPLDCAGKALISQGPISTIACYWAFGYCFGALVIDCWWTGC